MHEFSIATQLLESALEFLQDREPCEILAIRVEIGELMCVEAEQLRFCFDSIKQETPLENSVLEISFAPAAVECPHCQYEGLAGRWDGAISGASIPTLQCPRCGKAVKAVQGHDCAIKSIRVSTNSVKNYDECDPFTAADAPKT